MRHFEGEDDCGGIEASDRKKMMRTEEDERLFFIGIVLTDSVNFGSAQSLGELEEDEQEELSPKRGRGRSLCPRSVVDHCLVPDSTNSASLLNDFGGLFSVVECPTESVSLAPRPRPRCVESDVAVWAVLNPHH